MSFPSSECGFDSRHPLRVMSQDIGDRWTHVLVGSPVLFPGCSGWPAGGLVAAGGVEDQVAEEFSGGGVDDADVEVLDEGENAGSGVGSADAEGVEPAAVAQGDLPGLVDAVDPD